MEASQQRTHQDHASDLRQHRRLPVGADVLPSGGVHFRVWASRRQHVEVVLEGGPGHHSGAEPISVALEPEGGGYFSGLVPDASAGTLYRYRLDRGAESYPDAVSRFQPRGPHGPSQVIDPGAFQWHDQGWRGVPLEGQVMYEMHVGTFTPAGTWEAAMGEPPALAELDVTIAAFVLRFFGTHGDDRLLVVNLGRALHLDPVPEPLLAPPEGMDWTILWSTEDARYGGCGTAPLEDENNWHLPSHAAMVLRPNTRQEREE